MLEAFKSFILQENLCRPSETVLLTVSGGVDSVAMLDLFHSAGFKTGIAHCNFQLRGAESEGDEQFVRTLGDDRGLACHVRSFDTQQVAAEEGISIQMAARNLRYAWFEELRQQCRYDWIATAHNQDDILETFFINLSRGTGIRGLTGIPVRAGKLIRPLLFASREEILEYAGMNQLDFREDSSNTSEKYLRNKIRHKLIPLMEEQNPSFRQSMSETIEKLKDSGILYLREIERIKNLVSLTESDRTTINLRELLRMDPLKTILYEILADFSFTSHMMEDILPALEGPPGKQFFSSTHRMVKDRNQLIITPLEKSEIRKYYLELEQARIQEPLQLEWKVLEKTDSFIIPKDPEIACLDFDLLNFPLILRRWQTGDYFQPFGMKGMKKLSDYLIDMKVSLPDKEKVWLLTTGSKIVWVAGYRIDDRFRITEKTRNILMIKIAK